LKKLDWYIIKKYLGSFFFTSFIFTLISLVIDFSEKTEHFVEASKVMSAGQIFAQYQLNYIPFINGILWPLFSLIAVIFFTSRLAYNSEIISILNAGVSFRRLLRPYLIAGGFLTALLLLFNHYIIPNSNVPRLKFEEQFVNHRGDRKISNPNMHFFVSPDTKIYLRSYSPSDSVGYSFRLEQFKGTQLIYMLKANMMEWNKTTHSSWRLKDYVVRRIKDSTETVEVFEGKQLDTALNMLPSDFEFYSKQKDLMITPQLQKLVDKERSRGLNPVKDYLIEIYRRTADPFTILILTVIGVSIAARKVRGGMGLHLAIGISIGAIFVFISKFSVVFSRDPNIPSLLGIWLPNIIFSFIAYLLVRKAQQ
jgi:lipopolysaccharide export system permease protein